MSYEAIIAKLENVRPHSNANRLQLASCLGYQVVVGMDAKNGDIMVLFPDDGQLSEEYCKANDLIGYVDEATGEKKGGYFDQRRRVRAQTFRGEKSEAYVAALNTLAFATQETLVVGTRFSELNGIPICNKYVTPETLKAARANQPKTPKLNHQLKKLFPEHFDTDQLRHAQDRDLIGLVTITAKLHGTSQRSCLVKLTEESPRKWWEKLFNRPIKTTEKWVSAFGTRRVIKGEVKEGATDYRSLCHLKLQPHIKKGEVWFYEIVGFEDSGAPIMGTVDCTKMGKDFVKRFGKTMTYKYGCMPQQCEVYVYRIAVENEDGEMYELPWGVVKDKCVKAGIKHVLEIESSYVTDCPGYLRQRVEDWNDMKLDIAEPLDASHIREGVCVRVDRIDSAKSKIWKLKTFPFRCLEGLVKDSGVVDTEEAEGTLDEG